MEECPSDPPAVTAIKLDRRFIRLNDAKVQCFMAASDYFRLRLREQALAYPISAAIA